jgi:hypothetical protein|tara:strand:+ start:2415 stop:2603 length:189 start_codon:yes stop_codon:yes gene_type:complete
MEEYNFWADLLDTVRSTADWVKALGIVTWLALARFAAPPTGRPANDDDDQVARFRRVFMDRG